MRIDGGKAYSFIRMAVGRLQVEGRRSMVERLGCE